MRYGLHPLLRKMWSLIGTRVIAPVHRRFEWVSLFSAIEVEGSGSEFLYTEGLGKDTVWNVNWKSLEELENKLTQTLESLWRRPEGFSSLFTNSYLRPELNAITP